VTLYDRDHIASFFDEYGEQEWERLDQRPMDRVNFEVHRRMLDEHVRPGDRVLEIGAGPGRFTLELAKLGAHVLVGDVSARQLELHREKTVLVEDAVEARILLDVVDLHELADGRFDVAVCYGGPISYVLERADDALAELLRVTRPGGRVLLSVMSLLGAARAFFGLFPELIEEHGWEKQVTDVFATGVLTAEVNNGHVMKMYRWEELKALIARHPCKLLGASASNYLVIGNEDVFVQDERWLELELAASREPGALDAGTHIVAALERK
jgi:ubiquinone/menaquinone biosynthesis C-methylase UbiE